MEKVSLKNIKIVIIFAVVIVIVVCILKLQIANSTSKSKQDNKQQEQQKEQINQTPEENNADSGNEYIEPDDEYSENENTYGSNTNTDRNSYREENNTSATEASYGSYDSNETFDEFDNRKSERETSKSNTDSIFEQDEIKPEKKAEEKKVIVPVREKTPQEIYNFAVLEMKKGRYNSAIYEFNNAIDVLQDANTIMTARRYLASCYEKQGINTEAFDIYESIYLETGKKDDLIQLYRLGQKTKRTFTVHTYIQEYIDSHPDEQESLAGYLKY